MSFTEFGSDTLGPNFIYFLLLVISMDADLDAAHVNLDMVQIQVLLAEKRTSFALLRTGIAVFSLPLSVITVLIATSKYYDLNEILPLFVVLMIICFLLSSLGVYLILRSIRKIWKFDKRIAKIRSLDKELQKII